MSADPLDLAFIGLALAIGLVTAVKPGWTFYVLTYGHPERVSNRSQRVMRFFAAWMALGAIVSLVQIALRHRGL